MIFREITVISAYDFKSREILSTKEGLFASRSEKVIILQEKTFMILFFSLFASHIHTVQKRTGRGGIRETKWYTMQVLTLFWYMIFQDSLS